MTKFPMSKVKFLLTYFEKGTFGCAILESLRALLVFLQWLTLAVIFKLWTVSRSVVSLLTFFIADSVYRALVSTSHHFYGFSK